MTRATSIVSMLDGHDFRHALSIYLTAFEVEAISQMNIAKQCTIDSLLLEQKG